jgi:nucleoside-diphosphate kinase
MPLLHHQRPRQQRDGSFLDRAHHGADPLSVAMKLGIDQGTTAPFFALACTQQASVPPRQGACASDIILNFLVFILWEPRMPVERTLSIIKPDAVARSVIGEIYTRFERAGLKIVAAKMTWLARPDAEGFYAVHRERPFFKDLVEFMTSGPVMIQVLEGDNAIAKNRDLMGATDPKKAAAGTIRADFAQSIDANAVHGSDGPETAETEIEFFFPPQEIHSR